MSVEICDVVDEFGTRTGRVVTRGTELAVDEFYLAVHVWIRDENGEYLIQRRAPHLEYSPISKGMTIPMAQIICVHDKANIETFLRRDPILHLFGLGDLDDFYWPYTGWYALADDNEIRQLILTYIDAPNLVMMALANERIEEMVNCCARLFTCSKQLTILVW